MPGIKKNIGLGLVRHSTNANLPDPNADAFILAAGITADIQKAATTRLVKDLKAINAIQPNFVNFDNPATSIIRVFYPLLGSTANSCKFNLLNPLDSDAANRIVFDNGFTFNAEGIKGGTNLKADTKLNFNNFKYNDFTLGYYHPTSTKEVALMHTSGFNISSSYIANRFSGYNFNLLNSNGGSAVDKKKYILTHNGLISINLKTDIDLMFYDKSMINQIYPSSAALANANIWIGSWNSGGSAAFGDIDPISLFYAGKGISAAAMPPFVAAISKFLKSTGKMKPNYYFYGDSITNGLNASPAATKRYSYLLSQDCGALEVNRSANGQVLSKYLSGTSFESDITSVANETKYIDYYSPHTDSLLFLGYGVNEPLNASFDQAKSLTAWENVIDLIHTTKDWPYSRIVITGPFVKNDGTIATQSAFNQILKTMIEAKGCPYVNVFDALNGTTGYIDSDNIHLTNSGHQYASNIIKSKLNSSGLI